MLETAKISKEISDFNEKEHKLFVEEEKPAKKAVKKPAKKAK